MDLKNKTLARSNRTNNLHCGNNSGTKMHPALAMKSGLTTLWIAFCFILLLNVGARAQAISGDLIGTVEDATGAAVPNATLTITNINTNAKATATSNDAGQYRFSNLIPGTYEVSFATIPSGVEFTVQNTPGDNGNNTNSDANT